MPLFITGSLGQEQTLSICRLLGESPDLMREMRLALALREGLLNDAPSLPPFPMLGVQQARRKTFLPPAVHNSLQVLKYARDITGSAIRLAMKFM